MKRGGSSPPTEATKKLKSEADAGDSDAAGSLVVKDIGVVGDESEAEMMNACIKLNNGVAMPWVGVGTYRLKTVAEASIKRAVKLGYKLIDTAYIYDGKSHAPVLACPSMRSSMEHESA